MKLEQNILQRAVDFKCKLNNEEIKLDTCVILFWNREYKEFEYYRKIKAFDGWKESAESKGYKLVVIGGEETQITHDDILFVPKHTFIEYTNYGPVTFVF